MSSDAERTALEHVNDGPESVHHLERAWRGDAPRWVLLLAIVGAAAGIQLVARTDGAVPVLLMVVYVLILDVVALRWGADSRDGRDWKPPFD